MEQAPFFPFQIVGKFLEYLPEQKPCLPLLFKDKDVLIFCILNAKKLVGGYLYLYLELTII